MYYHNLANSSMNQKLGSSLNTRNLNSVNTDLLTDKEIYSNIDLYPEVAAERFASNVANGLRDRLIKEGLLPSNHSDEVKT